MKYIHKEMHFSIDTEKCVSNETKIKLIDYK